MSTAVNIFWRNTNIVLLQKPAHCVPLLSRRASSAEKLHVTTSPEFISSCQFWKIHKCIFVTGHSVLRRVFIWKIINWHWIRQLTTKLVQIVHILHINCSWCKRCSKNICPHDKWNLHQKKNQIQGYKEWWKVFTLTLNEGK